MSAFSQLQAINLISTMSSVVNAAIEQNRDSQPTSEMPNTKAALLDFSVDVKPAVIAAEMSDYLRFWLPSTASLVDGFAMSSAIIEEELNIRDFSKFVKQFETPTASADECLQLSRAALCECSLSEADFRHAVDIQIEHTSSVWQNN